MDVEEVNKLIRSQEDDYQEIKRIWVNIKKDSVTRKTQKYVDDKRATLDDIFRRACRNHDRLREQELLSSHKYMTLNYFETNIKRLFNEVVTYLATVEETLDKDIKDQDDREYSNVKTKDKPIASGNLDGGNHSKTIATSNDGRNSNMSEQLFLQKYRINQLRKCLMTVPTATTGQKAGWQLRALTGKLEKLFQDIDDNHGQLLLLAERSTVSDEYFIHDFYTDIKDEYDSAMEKLLEKINDIDTQYKKPSTTKLPRITIPYFTGSYESWDSFFDLFKKVIDNDQTLSTTEKMQYLKTYVRGDAEKLIKHLTVNEVNYKAALRLLVDRYKDKRRVTQTFIDKLLDLPKIHHTNAKMLREMHDSINESLEAIKNQNVDISTWDPILIRIVNRKWDPETNMKYEDQLNEPNELQKFSEMLKFLEKRFKSLESSKMENKHPFTPPVQRGNEKPSHWHGKKGLCWYCNSEHNIHQCESFISLHQRWAKCNRLTIND